MYNNKIMSDTVIVQTVDATRARDLLTLYSKKAAFILEEYVDVGGVFKNVSDVLTEDAGETVTLTKNDVSFLLNTINVCSQRTAVDVQNYKPIAALHESLTEALKTSEKEAS